MAAPKYAQATRQTPKTIGNNTGQVTKAENRLLTFSNQGAIRQPHSSSKDLSSEQQAEMLKDLDRIRAILKEPDLEKTAQNEIILIIRKYIEPVSSESTFLLDKFLSLLKLSNVGWIEGKWFFGGIEKNAIVYDRLWYVLDSTFLSIFKQLVERSKKEKTHGPNNPDAEKYFSSENMSALAKQEAMGIWGMVKGLGLGLAGIAGPVVASELSKSFDDCGEIFFGKDWNKESIDYGFFRMTPGQIGEVGGNVIWMIIEFARLRKKAGTGPVTRLIDKLNELEKIKKAQETLAVIGGLQGIYAGAKGIAEIIESEQIRKINQGQKLTIDDLLKSSDFIAQLEILFSSSVNTLLAVKDFVGSKSQAEISRARIHLLLSSEAVLPNLGKLIEIAQSEKPSADKERAYGEILNTLIPQLVSLAFATENFAYQNGKKQAGPSGVKPSLVTSEIPPPATTPIKRKSAKGSAGVKAGVVPTPKIKLPQETPNVVTARPSESKTQEESAEYGKQTGDQVPEELRTIPTKYDLGDASGLPLSYVLPRGNGKDDGTLLPQGDVPRKPLYPDRVANDPSLGMKAVTETILDSTPLPTAEPSISTQSSDEARLAGSEGEKGAVLASTSTAEVGASQQKAGSIRNELSPDVQIAGIYDSNTIGKDSNKLESSPILDTSDKGVSKGTMETDSLTPTSYTDKPTTMIDLLTMESTEQINTKPNELSEKEQKAAEKGMGVLQANKAKARLNLAMKEKEEAEGELYNLSTALPYITQELVKTIQELIAQKPILPRELKEELKEMRGRDGILILDPETSIETLERLRNQKNNTLEAKNYIDWAQDFIIAMNDRSGGVETDINRKVDILRISKENKEKEFNSSLKSIDDIIRDGKGGENYKRKVGENRDDFLRAPVSSSEVDHLYPVALIKRSPQMLKLIEMYNKLRSTQRERLVTELENIGDLETNLFSIKSEVNQEKRDRLWEEIGLEQAKKWGYNEDQFKKMVEKQEEQKKLILDRLQSLINEFMGTQIKSETKEQIAN